MVAFGGAGTRDGSRGAGLEKVLIFASGTCPGPELTIYYY